MAQPLQSLLPKPDGTIDAADRFHLLGLYGGVLILVPPEEVILIMAPYQHQPTLKR